MDRFEMLSTLDEMIDTVEGRVPGKTWEKHWDFRAFWDDVDGGMMLGMCLGGMAAHLHDGRCSTSSVPSGFLMHSSILRAIGKVVIEQYPERLDPDLRQVMGDPAYQGAAIVPFNDHPETTKEDIVRVLEKTRVAVAEAV